MRLPLESALLTFDDPPDDNGRCFLTAWLGTGRIVFPAHSYVRAVREHITLPGVAQIGCESVFISSPLDSLLRRSSIRRLLFAYGDLVGCVETSVRVAVSMGYCVFVLKLDCMTCAADVARISRWAEFIDIEEVYRDLRPRM